MLKKTNGFSLLELMVVIGILALVAAIAIPRLRRRPLPLDRQTSSQLNSLMRTAQLNALITGKLHRVLADFKTASIRLEVDSGTRDSRKQIIFKQVSMPYARARFSLDPMLVIDRFLVKGKNLMQRGEDVESTSAWFYVIPEGLAQEVTIEAHQEDTSRAFTFVLNPFTAQFSVS